MGKYENYYESHLRGTEVTVISQPTLPELQPDAVMGTATWYSYIQCISGRLSTPCCFTPTMTDTTTHERITQYVFSLPWSSHDLQMRGNNNPERSKDQFSSTSSHLISNIRFLSRSLILLASFFASLVLLYLIWTISWTCSVDMKNKRDHAHLCLIYPCMAVLLVCLQ